MPRAPKAGKKPNPFAKKEEDPKKQKNGKKPNPFTKKK